MKNFKLTLTFLLGIAVFLTYGFDTVKKNRENQKLIEKLDPLFNSLPISFSKEEKIKIIKNPDLIIDILKNNYDVNENSKGLGCIHRCWRRFKNCTEYLDRYKRGSDKWVEIMDKCFLRTIRCLSKCKNPNGGTPGVAQ